MSDSFEDNLVDVDNMVTFTPVVDQIPLVFTGIRRIVAAAVKARIIDRAVTYQEIREEYQKLYKVSLNPKELRKYFGYGVAKNILLKGCLGFFQILPGFQKDSRIVLSLNKPFTEIVKYLDETEKVYDLYHIKSFETPAVNEESVFIC